MSTTDSPMIESKPRSKFSLGLTAQIFIGLILGVAVGQFAPEWGKALAPGADVFLHLIKTIIAPLVFATLV
ncbi:MAG TPA: cation:dicarboxylase symporter family transporter, partial [Candidatus Obscuribacter sp.]|nr:cation:dicarboxylase symporter family transporter [Candidatus Obscuribacter sp.]